MYSQFMMHDQKNIKLIIFMFWLSVTFLWMWLLSPGFCHDNSIPFTYYLPHLYYTNLFWTQLLYLNTHYSLKKLPLFTCFLSPPPPLNHTHLFRLIFLFIPILYCLQKSIKFYSSAMLAQLVISLYALSLSIFSHLLLLLLLLLLLVFSPWAGLGRDQSSVRRLVWLWYAASWASS